MVQIFIFNILPNNDAIANVSFLHPLRTHLRKNPYVLYDRRSLQNCILDGCKRQKHNYAAQCSMFNMSLYSVASQHSTYNKTKLSLSV